MAANLPLLLDGRQGCLSIAEDSGLAVNAAEGGLLSSLMANPTLSRNDHSQEIDAAQLSQKWAAIPHFPLGCVPEGLCEEQPLLYRRIIAKRALVAGYEDAGEGGDTLQALVDAFADLRHLCDGLGVSFERMSKAGYEAYLMERSLVKDAGHVN